MNAARLERLVGPATLVAATALLGSTFARETQIYFITALLAVSFVVAVYIFVGNSGVLSFGHISFVAVGAWGAGVLSVPVDEKSLIFPRSTDSSATRQSTTSPRWPSPRRSASATRSSSEYR